MKKALKKQAALVMLLAAIAAQTGFPGFAEATVTGNWKNENGTWKFYSPDQKAYTGWIKTANGWYSWIRQMGKWQSVGRTSRDTGIILTRHQKALKEECISAGTSHQIINGISLIIKVEIHRRVRC